MAATAVPTLPRALSERVTGALEAIVLERARQARARRPAVAAGLFVVGAAVAGAIAWRSDDPAPEASPRAEQGIRPAPIASVTPGSVAEGSTRTGDVAVTAEVPQPGATLQLHAALDPNSIVVLPQPGAEADPHLAALLREFHEEFLVQLSSVDGLTVVSRERVSPFIGSLLPEEQIARQLGAGTIMGLGIHAEGDLFLSVVLLDGATGASRGSSSSVLREPVTRAEVREHVQHVVAFLKEMRTGRTIDRATRIAKARAIVLNNALSDAERVHALRMLPLHSPGAFDDAIVAAAVEIATTSDIANRRAYVWEVMRGVGHPYLVEPLLQSLAYDTSDYVRRMAALTLGDFRDEPRVLAALKRAQARDVSGAVRDAARLTLLSDQERNELALQTLLDETLPALERLDALSIFDGRGIRIVPLTAEAARAVFDIATSSEDVATRSIAWGRLASGGIRNPAFTGALLDDVASHPSPSVRAEAVRALEAYRDDPDVRAALAQAKVDPSADVRRAARSVLGETAR
ncbi:MAG TPA: HEAT repeat domain-containing protein [Woeseiaceae bacterium]|nr:HEAT repeat domain-containing protein [Woeseiaceae bacterium]